MVDINEALSALGLFGGETDDEQAYGVYETPSGSVSLVKHWVSFISPSSQDENIPPEWKATGGIRISTKGETEGTYVNWYTKELAYQLLFTNVRPNPNGKGEIGGRSMPNYELINGQYKKAAGKNACASPNGEYPYDQYIGTVVKDINTGKEHRIGFSADGNPVMDPTQICRNCPFAVWQPNGAVKTMCNPAYEAVLWVYPQTMLQWEKRTISNAKKGGAITVEYDLKEVPFEGAFVAVSGRGFNQQSALFPSWKAIKEKNMRGIRKDYEKQGSVECFVPLDLLNAANKNFVVFDSQKQPIVEGDKIKLNIPTSIAFPMGDPTLRQEHVTMYRSIMGTSVVDAGSTASATAKVTIPHFWLEEAPASQEDVASFVTAAIEVIDTETITNRTRRGKRFVEQINEAFVAALSAPSLPQLPHPLDMTDDVPLDT